MASDIAETYLTRKNFICLKFQLNQTSVFYLVSLIKKPLSKKVKKWFGNLLCVFMTAFCLEIGHPKVHFS